MNGSDFELHFVALLVKIDKKLKPSILTSWRSGSHVSFIEFDSICDRNIELVDNLIGNKIQRNIYLKKSYVNKSHMYIF